VRPLVVGKWTSSICMALSCSKTQGRVRPGAGSPWAKVGAQKIATFATTEFAQLDRFNK
jgi:hypothetical protein